MIYGQRNPSHLYMMHLNFNPVALMLLDEGKTVNWIRHLTHTCILIYLSICFNERIGLVTMVMSVGWIQSQNGARELPRPRQNGRSPTQYVLQWQ